MAIKYRYFFVLLFFSLFLFSFSKVDLENIDVDKLYFPKEFHWGVSTAEYQNSGANTCPNTNWAEWEDAFDEEGNPRIVGGQKIWKFS